MTAQRTTACPRCGNRASLEADNAWRPFCSERCKLIDLGEWFAERHVIVSETDTDIERDDELSATDPRQRRQ